MDVERWDVQQALKQFVALQEVTSATREALAQAIEDELLHRSRARLSISMRDALRYLEEVREGFTLSVRTEQATDLRELAYLVDQLLIDWRWLSNVGIELGLPEVVERVGRQVLAFAMAAIALSIMPKLPPEAVTFPLKRLFPVPSYADIPVPKTPAEVWERLEEVERVVYMAGIRPLRTLHPSPLRRAYAFFEANAWVAEQHVNRFLGQGKG